MAGRYYLGHTNTKHFHQQKAVWTEMLQSGNNQEAERLLSTDDDGTVVCAF